MAKKVLIVDDEKDLRYTLGAAIRDAGYDVLEARDGEEGLQLATKEHPDLILLDVIMPKLDGLGMLERLRADAWGQSAKVVMLTVLEDMESVSRAVTFGTHDYLVKTDWKVEDVVAKVKEKVGE